MKVSVAPSTVTDMQRASRIRDFELRERSSRSLLANVLDLSDDFRDIAKSADYYKHCHGNSNHCHDNSNHCVPPEETPKHQLGTSAARSPMGTPYELREILKEVRYMAERSRREEAIREVQREWRLASSVIDRLCLILFTILNLLTTVSILLSAPHIFS